MPKYNEDFDFYYTIKKFMNPKLNKEKIRLMQKVEDTLNDIGLNFYNIYYDKSVIIKIEKQSTRSITWYIKYINYTIGTRLRLKNYRQSKYYYYVPISDRVIKDVFL